MHKRNSNPEVVVAKFKAAASSRLVYNYTWLHQTNGAPIAFISERRPVAGKNLSTERSRRIGGMLTDLLLHYHAAKKDDVELKEEPLATQLYYIYTLYLLYYNYIYILYQFYYKLTISIYVCSCIFCIESKLKLKFVTANLLTRPAQDR